MKRENKILSYGRRNLLIALALLFTIHYSLFSPIAVAQKYPERKMVREGNKLWYGGGFAEAEAAYRNALEADPMLKEAQFNLGNALFRQTGEGEEEKGKIEEAAKAYQAVANDSLAGSRLVSAANFNLGNTMLAGQKIDKAIEFYKQALRIAPADMQAKYNLAYAQKLKQQQEQQDKNQNQNQDQDQDQNQNQDNDGQDDRNRDQQQGDDQNDRQNDGQNDPKDVEGNEPPPPPKKGEGKASINPEDAANMLEAMQSEEDKTREKMNAKEVPAVGRSGKNW